MQHIINFALPQASGWIVNIIAWLVGLAGVGLGVILFTVLLKLVTLPFDYISKAQMRKNSIKMEEMREDLEKLQKQYANDKALYNQKMMALYKKNGYSMWGACLPTILTLVIFIIAISAFTKFSQYQNRQYYYQMSQQFNSVVYDGIETDGTYIKNENGKIVVDDAKVFGYSDTVSYSITENGVTIYVEKVDTGDADSDINYFNVTTENGFVQYRKAVSKNQTTGEYKFSNTEWYLDYDNIQSSSLLEEVMQKHGYNQTYNTFASTWKVANFKNVNNLTGKPIVTTEQLTEFNAKPDNQAKLDYINSLTIAQDVENVCKDYYIYDIQSTLSAKSYRNEKASFLWVKNIWVTDSPMKNPVSKDISEFKSITGYEMNAKDYSLLIAKLDKETTEANGYFILVALTVITSLLTQLVTSKSQKAQMELQTVDGQGAQTNKVMMWMMPIMMAIFAFIYTAAFSLYIVLSNLIGLGTTLLINYIVGKKYKSNPSQKKTVVRGRVYNEPKKEEPPKKKGGLFSKKEETPANDFLSGLADNKKPNKKR